MEPQLSRQQKRAAKAAAKGYSPFAKEAGKRARDGSRKQAYEAEKKAEYLRGKLEEERDEAARSKQVSPARDSLTQHRHPRHPTPASL